MRLPLTILLMLIALAAPARAERLDLAALKCKDYLARAADAKQQLLMWIEGYYSEENASPILDFDKIKLDGDKIADFCSKNPNDSLINTAEKILVKQ